MYISPFASGEYDDTASVEIVYFQNANETCRSKITSDL